MRRWCTRLAETRSVLGGDGRRGIARQRRRRRRWGMRMRVRLRAARQAWLIAQRGSGRPVVVSNSTSRACGGATRNGGGFTSRQQPLRPHKIVQCDLRLDGPYLPQRRGLVGGADPGQGRIRERLRAPAASGKRGESRRSVKSAAAAGVRSRGDRPERVGSG